MKSFKFACSLILLAASVSLLGAQTAPRNTKAAVSEMVLRPGDIVKITVWRKEDMTGEFLIGPDGSIQHPVYNDLRITGMSLADVRQKLHDFLVAYGVEPRFVIEPQLAVAVGGEVRQPGLFNMPPGATVSRAIALAGPTERARFDRVRLLRDGRMIELNLADPTSQNAGIEIQSGDQIIVPVRRELWRDFIVPSASLLAGLAAVVTAVLNNQ
jgi:protein involved in polysaccharide export with SLBB domain